MMDEPEQTEVSDEEALKRLASVMASNAPVPDEKQNVHTFLHNVAVADDTTKIGNLRDDKDINELGIPKVPVRTFKSMALIADKIMGNEYFKEYFEKESEIITSTSLSRNAKLIELAIVQRREIADVTKKRNVTSNKGWFKKRIQGDSQDA